MNMNTQDTQDSFVRSGGSPPTLAPQVQVRAKPGPKPAHGFTMSAVDRQRASRAKKQEPEKRKIIAAIMLIQKNTIPTPMKEKKGRHTAEDIRTDNFNRLHRLTQELMELPLHELRRYLETLEYNSDGNHVKSVAADTGRPETELHGDALAISGDDMVESIDDQRMTPKQRTANRFLKFLVGLGLDMAKLKALPIEKQREVKTAWVGIWGNS